MDQQKKRTLNPETIVCSTHRRDVLYKLDVVQMAQICGVIRRPPNLNVRTLRHGNVPWKKCRLVEAEEKNTQHHARSVRGELYLFYWLWKMRL